MSRRGIRGRPTWAGARSTFATRAWARSRRWAAKATCRCIPLLAGSPAIDAVVGDTRPGQQRDPWIDNFDTGTPAAWTLFDPLVDGDGDGTAARDLGAIERSDRWQTELLAVRAQGPATHTVVTIPAAGTAAPAWPTPPRAPRTSS